MLALIIVFSLIAIKLFNHPARTYDENSNYKIWLKDVGIAESESPSGNFTPTGTLRDIPGIGIVKDVFVTEAASRNAVMVEFLTGIDQKYAGLVYLKGFPPPPDSCNVQLSGPWWQIVPLNVSDMNCPRGYNFTGGG